MNFPRLVKNYTFLVPDENLETLSAMLTRMNLPVVTPEGHVARSDFVATRSASACHSGHRPMRHAVHAFHACLAAGLH